MNSFLPFLSSLSIGGINIGSGSEEESVGTVFDYHHDDGHGGSYKGDDDISFGAAGKFACVSDTNQLHMYLNGLLLTNYFYPIPILRRPVN